MVATAPDTTIDLPEAVTQAIAQAAAAGAAHGGNDGSLHRAQARAALAAIEAAGFAIVPRPARDVHGSLGRALTRAESGAGAPWAEGEGDIRAAHHWLHSVAAMLDRTPEG